MQLQIVPVKEPKEGEPLVLLHMRDNGNAFACNAQLSPKAARDMAARLMAAADAVEQRVTLAPAGATVAKSGRA